MLKNNLNKLISSSGVSIRKIAEFSGLPYSTLYEINSGLQTNPTIATLIKLAICFNITIDELVYGEVKLASLEANKKNLDLPIQDYMVALNQKLIALCSHAKLSLADLTRLSGLPRSTLESLLKRRLIKSTNYLRSTRLNTIAPLTKVFSISLDELIGLQHFHSKKKV